MSATKIKEEVGHAISLIENLHKIIIGVNEDRWIYFLQSQGKDGESFNDYYLSGMGTGSNEDVGFIITEVLKDVIENSLIATWGGVAREDAGMLAKELLRFDISCKRELVPGFDIELDRSVFVLYSGDVKIKEIRDKTISNRKLTSPGCDPSDFLINLPMTEHGMRIISIINQLIFKNNNY